MASSVTDSKWLAPVKIATWTPALVVSSRLLGWMLSFCVLFTANAVLAMVMHAIWPPLRFAVIATLAASLVRYWKPLAAWIIGARAGLPLQHLQRRLSKLSSYSVTASLMSGIEPGTWVFPKKEWEEIRPRRRPGQSVPSVKITFKLCIAKYYVNGNETRVAFSDGTVQAWHSASYVLHLRFQRPIPRGLGYNSYLQSDEIADALLSLARSLDRGGGSTVECVLKDQLQEFPEAVVVHALRASVLWGIVTTAQRQDIESMYSLVSGVGPPTRDAATGVELRLTAAGRVWLDCNPEELKEADRRARMDKNRPTSMVFNAPVQGVHTGDNYGAISYTQVNRSDGEVLKALQTLLQSDTLWLQPDLESARTVVETAVSAGSVNDPNLRPALAKVLAVGGSLVLAVTGNSVYDVLKHFVTQ